MCLLHTYARAISFSQRHKEGKCLNFITHSQLRPRHLSCINYLLSPRYQDLGEASQPLPLIAAVPLWKCCNVSQVSACTQLCQNSAQTQSFTTCSIRRRQWQPPGSCPLSLFSSIRWGLTGNSTQKGLRRGFAAKPYTSVSYMEGKRYGVIYIAAATIIIYSNVRHRPGMVIDYLLASA